MSKLFSFGGVLMDKHFKKDARSNHEKVHAGGDNSQSEDCSTFNLKYLGSTLLDEVEDGKSYGNSISAEAVKIIVHMAKSSSKKLPQMRLTVSSKGINVVDTENNAVLTELDIHRIHFCTADKNHSKVFAYIARSTENETMECHAFLCPKWKVAKAVTLAVAHAFQAAKTHYEKEQEEAEKKRHEAVFARPASEAVKPAEPPPPPPAEVATGILVNLEPETQPAEQQQTMGFEDNFVDTYKPITEESRQNPFSSSRFSVGVEEQDIDDCVRAMAKGHSERLCSTDDDELMGL